MTIQIDGARICDWASFHDVFAELFGFPSWYGRNMDAWIDCMSTLDDAAAGLTKCRVQPGEFVALHVEHDTVFAAQGGEQYRALVECTEFVNERRALVGLPPLLALTFRDSK